MLTAATGCCDFFSYVIARHSTESTFIFLVSVFTVMVIPDELLVLRALKLIDVRLRTHLLIQHEYDEILNEVFF